MTDTPAQYSKAQRRLLTALGGLGATALTAAAFVLSYDDLRLLALRGGAVRHRAFLYPGMIDGLVVVVILSILTARKAGWASRALRWLLLLLLVAGAGTAGVQRAVNGYDAIPHAWASGGVAAAPWAILLIAVWLWLAMIKQVLGRVRRERPARVPAILDQAIIPGLTDQAADETKPIPSRPVRALGPVRTEPVPVPEPVPATVPDLTGEQEPDDHIELGDWTAPLDETQARDHTMPRTPAEARDRAEAIDQAKARIRAEESERAEEGGRDALSDWAEPAVPAPREAPEQAEQVETPEPAPAEEPPADDQPAPRLVARTSLPTDVRLVGGPSHQRKLADTNPDGIKLPDTQPDGIPLVKPEAEPDDDDEVYGDDRAEDPDAGTWVGEDGDPTPPFGQFRSSPTPPRD